MGDITILWVIMLLIALVSFAPLGILIYRFSQKADDPLGLAHATHQPNPKIEAWIDGLLGRFLIHSHTSSASSVSQTNAIDATPATEEPSTPVKKLRGKLSRKKSGSP